MTIHDIYFVKAEIIAKIALKKIIDLNPPDPSPDPFGNGAQLCDAISIAKEALMSIDELRKSYCSD